MIVIVQLCALLCVTWGITPLASNLMHAWVSGGCSGCLWEFVFWRPKLSESASVDNHCSRYNMVDGAVASHVILPSARSVRIHCVTRVRPGGSMNSMATLAR